MKACLKTIHHLLERVDNRREDHFCAKRYGEVENSTADRRDTERFHALLCCFVKHTTNCPVKIVFFVVIAISVMRAHGVDDVFARQVVASSRGSFSYIQFSSSSMSHDGRALVGYLATSCVEKHTV